jgi:nicotinamidase-related amidase
MNIWEDTMNRYLVVVDMQNDFTYGALRNEEAIAIIPGVEKKIREFDGNVIFTYDTHQKNYMETQEGRNLPVPHCIEGTDGWQLVEPLEKLQKTGKYVIFKKNTFGSTDLAAYLVEENQKKPIDEIEFIGICTDICVISNVLLTKAHLPEVKLSVDASCCAGVTPESHRTALDAMKACQVEIEGAPEL